MKDWFYTVLYRRQINVRHEHVEQVRLNAKRRGDTSVVLWQYLHALSPET